MLTLANPLLIWGLGGAAVPLLIHLLVRQRPRPHAWAAMLWLLAARRRAERKYKLTNLLLLLLRMLLVALLALAMARPLTGLLGGGGKLVLVVDATASMGSLDVGPGGLDLFRSQVGELPGRYAGVVLFLVDDRLRFLGEVERGRLNQTLAGVMASPLPGGLDRIAMAERAAILLERCRPDSQVVLVSDFRQDEGSALQRLIEERGAVVHRLRVGEDAANTFPVTVPGSISLLAGSSGEAAITLSGPARSVLVRIDQDQPLPGPEPEAGGRLRLGLPPLPAGRHLVSVSWTDGSLSYDNRLDLPVTVRDRLRIGAVAAGTTYLATALLAESARLETRRIHPADLPAQALEQYDLLALRHPAPDLGRLVSWVQNGGVVWTSAELLAATPELAPLAGELHRNDPPREGGSLTARDPEVDRSLGKASLPTVPAWDLPTGHEVLLSAGAAPLVVSWACGKGRLVVELADLERCHDLWATGAAPFWTARTAERILVRSGAMQIVEAGVPLLTPLILRRESHEVKTAAGQPLLVAPGLWSTRQADGTERLVLVMPNQDEGRLSARPGAPRSRSLAELLPESTLGDRGPLLLLLALILAVLEGAIARQAGRAYGG